MPNTDTADAQSENWITRDEQLACLVSATRLDMIDHLAAHGPMPVRELATAIGMKPSAVYHHLEQLASVGLVVEAGKSMHNGKAEVLYNTLSRRMRLRRALEQPRHADIMRKIVTALSRRADRDFARGIGQDRAHADGDDRNLGFFRLVSRMDAERLSKINGLLDQIAELMWMEPEEDGELVALTWVMSPLE